MSGRGRTVFPSASNAQVLPFAYARVRPAAVQVVADVERESKGAAVFSAMIAPRDQRLLARQVAEVPEYQDLDRDGPLERGRRRAQRGAPLCLPLARGDARAGDEDGHGHESRDPRAHERWVT